MEIKAGSDAEFEATFTDGDGNLYDPDASTVKIALKKPDGTYYTGYAFTDNVLMTKLSTGVYRRTLQTAVGDPTGTYTVEVKGSVGTNVSMSDIKVSVKA